MKLLKKLADEKSIRFIADHPSYASDMLGSTESSAENLSPVDQVKKCIADGVEIPDAVEQSLRAKAGSQGLDLSALVCDAASKYGEKIDGQEAPAFFADLTVLLEQSLDGESGKESEQAFPESINVLSEQYGSFEQIPAHELMDITKVTKEELRSVLVTPEGIIDFKGNSFARRYVGLGNLYDDEFLVVDGVTCVSTKTKFSGEDRMGYQTPNDSYVAILGGEKVESLEQPVEVFKETDQYLAMLNQGYGDIPARPNETARLTVDQLFWGKVKHQEENPQLNILKNNFETEAKQVYLELIEGAAERHNVPVTLIQAVIQAESSGNPNARSDQGALGLMQLMPDTAKELGVVDALDPAQNIEGGTKYLAQLLKMYGGDEQLALSAYNWGMGNLSKVRPNGNETFDQIVSSLPPETQNYIPKVAGFKRVYENLAKSPGEGLESYNTAYRELVASGVIRLKSTKMGYKEDGSTREPYRTSIVGLRKTTIDGMKALCSALGGQTQTCTGGSETGSGHVENSNPNAATHANGCKLDLSTTQDLIMLTGLTKCEAKPRTKVTKVIGGITMDFYRHAPDHFDVKFS